MPNRSLLQFWPALLLPAGFVALMLLIAGFALFHGLAPSGETRQHVDAIQRLTAAHDAGRHAEVVRIYEGGMDVTFIPFTPLRWDLQLANSSSVSVRYRAADAYQRQGRTEDARALYLDILGWNELEYLSFCALADSCGDLAALRLAASQMK